MGIQERRQREQEELRAKILDAARELFASEGYDAVTMRKIAEKIEYSPTAIYLHFRDKENLIRELCGHDFLELAKKFQAMGGSIEDPLARLAAAGQAYFEFAVEHPHHYRLMFMMKSPTKPEDFTCMRGNPEEDAYAFLLAAVNDCISAGLFRPEIADAELVAQTCWAAIHGVVSLHIAKGDDEWVAWHTLERRFSVMMEAVVRGLMRTPVSDGG